MKTPSRSSGAAEDESVARGSFGKRLDGSGVCEPAVAARGVEGIAEEVVTEGLMPDLGSRERSGECQDGGGDSSVCQSDDGGPEAATGPLNVTGGDDSAITQGDRLGDSSVGIDISMSETPVVEPEIRAEEPVIILEVETEINSKRQEDERQGDTPLESERPPEVPLGSENERQGDVPLASDQPPVSQEQIILTDSPASMDTILGFCDASTGLGMD